LPARNGLPFFSTPTGYLWVKGLWIRSFGISEGIIPGWENLSRHKRGVRSWEQNPMEPEEKPKKPFASTPTPPIQKLKSQGDEPWF
jgi:hypothetical protein